MIELPGTATRSMADDVRAAIASGAVELPPLPELTLRVRKMIESEDADAKAVAAMIRHDAAVSAAVIRVANSAAYGGLQTVTDLGPAVVRLGLRVVGAVVVVVAHKGNFHSADPARLKLLRSLWDHAVATAICARRIARTGTGDAEEAFLAGLLHDAGRLLTLRAVDYLEQQGHAQVTLAVVEDLMDLLHAELGTQVLESWKLPEPVCRVARQHHDPAAAATDLLVARVQAGCAVARKVGAHTHPDPHLRLLELPCVDRLKLGDLELASLMVDLEDEVAEIRRLL